MNVKEVKSYMKTKLSLLVLVLCLGVTTSAFATDSFVCIGGKIIYFIYEKNTQECRSITEESYNIYIIERNKNEKYTWGLRKPGKDSIPYLCDKDSNESKYLLCDFMGDFKMFKHNLRFMNSHLEGLCYPTGYKRKVNGDEREGVPYIEIGRCHPFS